MFDNYLIHIILKYRKELMIDDMLPIWKIQHKYFFSKIISSQLLVIQKNLILYKKIKLLSYGNNLINLPIDN